MLSGMLAAEHVAGALAQGRANDELSGYEDAWRSSPVGAICGGAKFQAVMVEIRHACRRRAGGLDMWTNTLGFSVFGTLKHGKPD